MLLIPGARQMKSSLLSNPGSKICMEGQGTQVPKPLTGYFSGIAVHDAMDTKTSGAGCGEEPNGRRVKRSTWRLGSFWAMIPQGWVNTQTGAVANKAKCGH